MRIKYLGPNDHVVVEPYGKHLRDQVKSYSRKFGEELLATSEKQMFKETNEPVTVEDEAQAEPEAEQNLEDKTMPELTAMLKEKGVEIPPNARKAELIEMLESD